MQDGAVGRSLSAPSRGELTGSATALADAVLRLGSCVAGSLMTYALNGRR